MPKETRRTSVVLAEGLREGLGVLCSQQDRSMNYIVNKAVRELLEREGVVPSRTRKRVARKKALKPSEDVAQK